MGNWADLNERQQEYMKIIYETDQIQEQNEKKRAVLDQHSLPADQWRYMEYADTYTHIPQFEKRLFGYELLIFLLVLPDYRKS
ncbi:MAG TPA: hypothetical protein VGL94_06535 [Ktedonobacteraceae bacterium]|jgi:hypothetical protein